MTSTTSFISFSLVVVPVQGVCGGLYSPWIGTSLYCNFSQVITVSVSRYLWQFCSQAAQGGENIIYPIIKNSFTEGRSQSQKKKLNLKKKNQELYLIGNNYTFESKAKAVNLNIFFLNFPTHIKKKHPIIFFTRLTPSLTEISSLPFSVLFSPEEKLFWDSREERWGGGAWAAIRIKAM